MTTHKMLEVEEEIGESIDVYLRREYTDERKTPLTISDNLGVSPSTIRNWIDYFDISKNPEGVIRIGGIPWSDFETWYQYGIEGGYDKRNSLSISQSEDDKERSWYAKGSHEKWLDQFSFERKLLRLGVESRIGESIDVYLRREHADERKTPLTISDNLGVSPSTIRNWIRDFDASPDGHDFDISKVSVEMPTKRELDRMYHGEKKSYIEIAELKGVSRSTVGSWFKHYNISKVSVETPTKRELDRMYHGEKKSHDEISELKGVSMSTVRNWFNHYKIQKRTVSENRLLSRGIDIPSKDQLTTWYVEEKRTTIDIGKELGVSYHTVVLLLKNHNIPIRNHSERRFPEGFKKPSKEELQRWYVEEERSLRRISKKLGLGFTQIKNILQEYDIPIRPTSSTGKLPEGIIKPSKSELEDAYIIQRKPRGRIAREIGVSHHTVGKWLKEYGISKENISNKSQFLNFIRKDETARNLAAVAFASNGEATDIEQIILDLYEGKFKRENLHRLLTENREEISDLLGEGMTNLGSYIGEFTLGETKIMPLLMGEIITHIGEERITSSLEDRLVRILRHTYGPRFNQNPEETVQEISGRMKKLKGKSRGLYVKLRKHYQDTLKLRDELS